MPIVLDNTQGSTLGMAMSQHAIDKMIGQRMQMTDIYAKTSQMQGQLLHERGLAQLQMIGNLSGGLDLNNPSHKAMLDSAKATLDAANQKFNRVADTTAAHSEDIQQSDYNSFKNQYSRDAYYQNLKDNSYEPARKGGMLASIGNAIGNAAGAIGDAASSAYNSIVGPSKPADNSSGATAPTSAPLGPDPAPTQQPSPATSSSPDINTALDNIKAKYNLTFETKPSKTIAKLPDDYTDIYKNAAFNPMRK